MPGQYFVGFDPPDHESCTTIGRIPLSGIGAGVFVEKAFSNSATLRACSFCYSREAPWKFPH